MLRDRLHQHNRAVLLFAVLSAAGAVLCWGVLYALSQWLTLLAITIVRGTYAALPTGFAIGFAGVAAALLFSAWLDRKVTTNDLPPDEKSPREIAMDFMLAVPRMTLAIGGNLSAWQRLTTDQLVEAAHLLERVSRERRVAMHEIPLELPDPHEREIVLNALLLLGVVEIQHADDGIWLRVPPAVRETFGLPALM
jgi:hypothetical protein